MLVGRGVAFCGAVEYQPELVAEAKTGRDEAPRDGHVGRDVGPYHGDRVGFRAGVLRRYRDGQGVMPDAEVRGRPWLGVLVSLSSVMITVARLSVFVTVSETSSTVLLTAAA